MPLALFNGKIMSYTKISNEVIELTNISDGAFRLYILLQKMCYGEKNSCFPSQGYLASTLNKSCKTIGRYIEELVSLGLVESKRRGSSSNLYVLVDKTSKEDESIKENSGEDTEKSTDENTGTKEIGSYIENSESKGEDLRGNKEVAVDSLKGMPVEENKEKATNFLEVRNVKETNNKNNSYKGNTSVNNYQYNSRTPAEKHIYNKKKDNFNNYEQRKYNTNILEAMLLGYEKYDEDKLYAKENSSF